MTDIMADIKFGKQESLLIKHWNAGCDPMPIVGYPIIHPFLEAVGLKLYIFKRAKSGNSKWRTCEYRSGEQFGSYYDASSRKRAVFNVISRLKNHEDMDRVLSRLEQIEHINPSDEVRDPFPVEMLNKVT